MGIVFNLGRSRRKNKKSRERANYLKDSERQTRPNISVFRLTNVNVIVICLLAILMIPMQSGTGVIEYHYADINCMNNTKKPAAGIETETSWFVRKRSIHQTTSTPQIL